MDDFTAWLPEGVRTMLALGGVSLVILLALSAIGTGVTVAKVLGFAFANVWSSGPDRAFWACVRDRQVSLAQAQAQAARRADPISKMLAVGLGDGAGGGQTHRIALSMKTVALGKVDSLSVGLGWLLFLAVLAPVVGLIGTLAGPGAGLVDGPVEVLRTLLPIGVSLAVTVQMLAAWAFLYGAVHTLSRRMEAATSRLLALLSERAWEGPAVPASMSTVADMDEGEGATVPAPRFSAARPGSLGGWKDVASGEQPQGPSPQFKPLVPSPLPKGAPTTQPTQ